MGPLGLVICVVVACCAASPHLATALDASLVRLEPLSPEERAAGGHVGRHRVVAVRDLAAGDVWATLSPAHVYTAHNASQVLPLPPASLTALSSVQRLMLLLLSPSLDWLLDETAHLSPPLLWDRDDVMELRETQLWGGLRDALAVLKQKHGQLVKPLVASGVLDAARYSFARWKRAYCLVKALQSVALDDAGTVTLVPWIALSSFGARGNANMHVTNDSSVQLVLSAPVSRGQAVVFNDDLGSNESDNFRLLELFGLLLSKRPFRYHVSVSLDRADPMYGNKRDLLDRYFSDRPRSPTHEFALDGKRIPRDLLFALRVYNAETTDAHDLRNALSDAPISHRNELASYETLGSLCVQKLRNFPTTLEQDGDLLRTRKAQLSRNAKNAVLWRRAEKRILTETLALVESKAKQLHGKWMVRDTDPLVMRGENHFETQGEL